MVVDFEKAALLYCGTLKFGSANDLNKTDVDIAWEDCVYVLTEVQMWFAHYFSNRTFNVLWTLTLICRNWKLQTRMCDYYKLNKILN